MRKETNFSFTSNEEINKSLSSIIGDFGEQLKQDPELTAEKYLTQNLKVTEDFARVWKYEVAINPKTGVPNLTVVQIKQWLIDKMKTHYLILDIKMHAAENAGRK